AVVGPLDELSEPARVLRGVDPVRVLRRSLEVVDLPAAEVRPGDGPLLPLLVRSQHERALTRAGQYPYLSHTLAFFPFAGFLRLQVPPIFRVGVCHDRLCSNLC